LIIRKVLKESQIAQVENGSVKQTFAVMLVFTRRMQSRFTITSILGRQDKLA